MPRSGKRKHRLTKNEIRRIRAQIASKSEIGELEETYTIAEQNKIPDIIYVSKKPNTHISVFEYFNPNIDYLKLNHKAIGFKNQVDREIYEKWFEEYSKKFGENIFMDFPPPCDGHYPFIEGVFLENENNRSSTTVSKVARSITKTKRVDSTEFLRWIWCLENCVGETRISGSYVYFSDIDDATLYRITFG